MEELADKIGQLCVLLEDGIEENDPDVIQEVLDKLNELYEDVDKSCYNDHDIY